MNIIDIIPSWPIKAFTCSYICTMPNTMQKLESDKVALNVKNPAKVVMADIVNCIILIHFHAEGRDWQNFISVQFKDHVTSDIRNAANGWDNHRAHVDKTSGIQHVKMPQS